MPPRARAWVWTLNNPCQDDGDRIEGAFEANECVLANVVGKEVGESGTSHLQGCTYFKSLKSMQQVKDLFEAPSMHLEKMQGTWTQASDYCKKDGDILCDHGEGPQQGKRNDIVAFREEIKSGKRTIDLLDAMPQMLAKFPRFYNLARETYQKEKARKYRDVKTTVLWGLGGTGKTARAVGSTDDHYLWSDYEHRWWDGYEGEDTLIMDDFYGGVPWSQFLRILDGHRYRIKVKGGFVYANWTKVFITSNDHPNEWYREHDMTQAQFARRIHEVVHLTEPYEHEEIESDTESVISVQSSLFDFE